MADYTWRQWEAEQNDANLLHASDCERWQAGIELAGGTWDGNWTDLDTSGKGLITIDQFNALESQIQSKVSSYTPKNYDPDSTVQIVPGVDGWNKVEDGILKAVCEPDGVNRNYIIGSAKMDVGTPQRNGSTSYTGTWNRAVEDPTSPTGYSANFISYGGATSDTYGFYFTSSSLNLSSLFLPELKEGTVFTLSFLAKSSIDGISLRKTNFIAGQTMIDSPDDFALSTEWTRIWATFESAGDSLGNPAIYVMAHSEDATIYIATMKIELGTLTDWSEAPEDYGYPGGTTLSANPQSVEDGDEIPAVEAGEIE